jgi:transcriptional regulator with XRE-family HTH domain
MSERDLELAALGQAIRQQREQGGMTPAELAAAAGVDGPYLEALEAGRPVVLIDAQSREAASVAFGRRLRKLRAEHGLSQDQLAERAGMRSTVIGRLERGVREPRLTTILRVARGLGVQPGALLDGLDNAST